MILILSLRIFFALYSEGFNHPDEHFQILEPAYGLIYHYWIKTYEWELGIRSYFLPYIFSFIIAGLKSINIEQPSEVIKYIRLLLVFYSLCAIYFIYRLGSFLNLQNFKFIPIFLMGFWWIGVYFSVRTMSETISLTLVLAGYYFIFKSYKNSSNNNIINGSGPGSSSTVCFISGIFIGISFLARFQCALFAVAIIVSLLFLKEYKKIPHFILGFLLMIIFQGLLDYYTWGEFLSSPIKYFLFNVINNGAAINFGASPWHRYLTMFNRQFTLGAGLFILIFSLYTLKFKVIKKYPLLIFLWSTLLIFGGVHQILSHKEDRFLLPLIPFFYLIFAMGLKIYWDENANDKVKKNKRKIVGIICCLSFLFGGGYKYYRENFKLNKDIVDTYTFLHEDEKIKGIMILGRPISGTGGYFYLHKDIPLLIFNNLREFNKFQKNEDKEVNEINEVNDRLLKKINTVIVYYDGNKENNFSDPDINSLSKQFKKMGLQFNKVELKKDALEIGINNVYSLL
ncbi:MAG: hypothetical protein HQK51_07265 [Oligoflexia bacterium]|nr:hypothetical protein [Oligoflexia bacterium]